MTYRSSILYFSRIFPILMENPRRGAVFNRKATTPIPSLLPCSQAAQLSTYCKEFQDETFPLYDGGHNLDPDRYPLVSDAFDKEIERLSGCYKQKDHFGVEKIYLPIFPLDRLGRIRDLSQYQYTMEILFVYNNITTMEEYLLKGIENLKPGVIRKVGRKDRLELLTKIFEICEDRCSHKPYFKDLCLALIQRAAVEDDPDSCLRYFNTLKETGIIFSDSVFISLHPLIKQDLKQMVTLFKEIKVFEREDGLDTVTTLMVEGFLEHGNIQEAFKYYIRHVNDLGFHPSTKLQHVMVLGLARSMDHLDVALQMVQESLDKCYYLPTNTYVGLINILKNENSFHAVPLLLKVAEKQGDEIVLSFKIASLNSLLIRCKQLQDKENEDKLFQLMVRMRRFDDYSQYVYMLDKLEDCNFEKYNDILKMIRESGKVPSQELMDHVKRLLADKFAPKTIDELFLRRLKGMGKESSEPNLDTLPKDTESIPEKVSRKYKEKIPP